MDFNPDQCPAITKAIIQLTDSLAGFNCVKRWLNKLMKFEEDIVIFYKEDKKIQS